jgi:hypothetical protein
LMQLQQCSTKQIFLPTNYKRAIYSSPSRRFN